MKRLNFLLEKSGAYATILGRKLAKQQEEAREKAAVIDKQNEQDQAEEQQVGTKGITRKTRRNTNNNTSSKKRKTNDADYQLTDYLKEDVTIYKRIIFHLIFI
jgi:ATP-dependent DNA helicase